MKILVPIDLSPSSHNAVEFVASREALLSSGTAARIEVLNVQQPLKRRSTFLLGQGSIDRYYEEHAERVFTRSRAILNREGLYVQETMLVGVPDQTIAEEAERIGADLIVMGTRGLGALMGLFKTSVSTGVVALAKCPVLLIRNGQSPKADKLKVGIAVDGSSYGAAAAKYVIRHRKLYGKDAEFFLLNVVNDYHGAAFTNVTGMALPSLSEEEVKELEKNDFEDAVSKVRPIFEKAGIKAKEVCLVGSPADELSAYAKANGLDLLVLGSHGYTRLKSAVMGSCAAALAEKGSVPILVVQNPNAGEDEEQ